MVSSHPAAIQQSQLLNRQVIDLDTTAEVGKIDHFLVDLDQHQVEGFVCRKGFLGQERTAVTWVQVESVGRDSLLVRRSSTSIPERFDAAVKLHRQQIWTDSGDKVGTLVDYCLDPQTGALTHYLFRAPGWKGLTDGVYTFRPQAVVSAGEERLIVRQSALEQAQQFIPSMQEQVTEALQQDYEQTRQDVQGVIDSAREAAGQVQQQTQKLTQQARSRFAPLFGDSPAEPADSATPPADPQVPPATDDTSDGDDPVANAETERPPS